MSAHFSIFEFMAMLDNYSFNSKFDLISKLPYELSTYIFRMLDTSSLMQALMVCESWFHLINRDPVLRKRVKNFLQDIRACKQIKENCSPGSDFYTFSTSVNHRGVSDKISDTGKAVIKRFIRSKRKRTECAQKKEPQSYKRARTLRL